MEGAGFLTQNEERGFNPLFRKIMSSSKVDECSALYFINFRLSQVGSVVLYAKSRIAQNAEFTSQAWKHQLRGPIFSMQILRSIPMPPQFTVFVLSYHSCPVMSFKTLEVDRILISQKVSCVNGCGAELSIPRILNSTLSRALFLSPCPGNLFNSRIIIGLLLQLR